MGDREIGMESRRSEFFKQAYSIQAKAADKAAGMIPEELPTKRVIPPISHRTLRHHKGTCHQDNLIMCVPPQRSPSPEKPLAPLVTAEDHAELYNQDFAHATRGRTYAYLERRRECEPEQKYSHAMTASQEMTWSMKLAQASIRKSKKSPTKHLKHRHPKTNQIATFFGKNKIPGFA